MTRFVVVLPVVFFCFSAVHLFQVSAFIQVELGRDIRSLIDNQIAKPPGQTATAKELQNSLLLLEADTLDKRYHQAVRCSLRNPLALSALAEMSTEDTSAPSLSAGFPASRH